MKKFVIYMLVMLMAFSPAAVFADVEAAADPGDAVEVTAEPQACTHHDLVTWCGHSWPCLGHVPPSWVPSLHLSL